MVDGHRSDDGIYDSDDGDDGDVMTVMRDSNGHG